jgi:hypothetical protein
VRRILPNLLEALGRPIGGGSWVDPMMGGRENTSGGVQEERLPKYRDPAGRKVSSR